MNDSKVVQVKILRPDGKEELSVNIPDKLWEKVPSILAVVNCLEYALGKAKRRGAAMSAEMAHESEQSTSADKNEIKRLNIMNNGNITINL